VKRKHRARKHFKGNLPLEKPPLKENLHIQKGNIPLNTARSDRISFSVLRNERNNIREIENISYEIYVGDNWEWVVRYDDHSGRGFLHRHYRISLNDKSEVESSAGIRRYKSKDHELTWVCNDIKRNYLIFRAKFLKNSKLDLY